MGANGEVGSRWRVHQALGSRVGEGRAKAIPEAPGRRREIMRRLRCTNRGSRRGARGDSGAIQEAQRRVGRPTLVTLNSRVLQSRPRNSGGRLRLRADYAPCGSPYAVLNPLFASSGWIRTWGSSYREKRQTSNSGGIRK
jgi:hypothetical protein